MLTTRAIGIALLAAAVTLPVAAETAAADIIVFTVNLDGPSESPPVPSPGVGSGTVTIDTLLHTMRVQVEFSGLVGTTTVAHIHAATPVPFGETAGVATSVPTFPGFPAGVMSGTYDQIFDMSAASSYNPTYLMANGNTALSAETALFQSFIEGRAYLNIHSSFRTSGEIRGFLVPSAGSTALFILGGIALTRRKRVLRD